MVHQRHGSGFVLLAVLLAPMAAFGQPQTSDDCADVQARMDSRLSTLRGNLDTNVKAKQAEIAERADKLKSEMPDPDKHPEAMIDFFFDVKSHDQDIILKLPEVTIKQQTLLLKLPDVTMKDQKWVWDRPVVKMATTQIGSKPEFTCRDVQGGPPFHLPGVQCDTKMTPIYADVPQVFMQREEAILGIPEFSMREQRIIMGIPEFSMRDQKIVVRIPDFTLKKISVEAPKLQKDGEALGENAKREIGGLTESFNAEVEKTTTEEIAATYACEGKKVAEKEKDTLAEIDKNISVVQEGLKKATEVGAKDMAAQMQKALSDLTAARAEAAKNFAKALSSMQVAQNKTFGPDGIPTAPSSAAARTKPYQFHYLRFPPAAS